MTPNLVWSIFDFAVVVTNPQNASVEVKVNRGAEFTTTETLPAKTARVVYLPWVTALKGPDATACGFLDGAAGTTRVDGGAYRLTSSLPVSVTQFNSIEAQAQGGPSGKSWSNCPKCPQAPLSCASRTADSSLLLPTSALGTSYRLASAAGSQQLNLGPTVTLTGTADGTHVSVTLSGSAQVVAGGGISAQGASASFSVTLQRADVIVLQASAKGDLSGSLISADQPLQVISGAACADVPIGKLACDHLEETVVPTTRLGKRHIVPVPQGPKGDHPGHVVRLVGHVDGTALAYPEFKPPNAPNTLSAGQVADLGLVKQDFVIESSQPIVVLSLIPGSEVLNGSQQKAALGDPAMRHVVPVSQYHRAYSVAAAPGFQSSHFELIIPTGKTVSLDGVPLVAAPKPLGSSGYGVLIVSATQPTAVFRSLTSDAPFGLQLVGFDEESSYAHPGGLNFASAP